jgi:Putative inner membrane protein (DUF1819)
VEASVMASARSAKPNRRDVVSSFTVIKGSMLEETYSVLSHWDFSLEKKENLDRLRDENYIGAQSSNWLREIARVINRRLDPGGDDKPLTVLAQGGMAMDEWKPIMLWHITRDEFLLRDFLVNWLFDAYQQGIYRIVPDDVVSFLGTISRRGGRTEHVWTETTTRRVAAGLLKIAADFGLLTSGAVKEFTHYTVPSRSLGYLLRAILAHESGSASRMITSAEWRMFLTTEDVLVNELLRLHQYREVEFEQAGSVVQLSLPAAELLQFAQELVA